MPSRRDKLKDQVEESTRGFAFDALIGTLSKPTEKEPEAPRQEPVAPILEEAPEKKPEKPAEDGRAKAPPVKKAVAKRTQVKNTTVISTTVNVATVEITTVEILSNYCRLDLDVSDQLAALQTPAEQVIYNRLYRLSYGEGKNICSVGTTRLVEATGIKSPKTIAQAIKGLVEKSHIAILDNHHHNPVKGTTYRVFLPGEIGGIKSKTKTKVTDA